MEHKEGRRTSHSYWSWTMVQGRLLMAHPGGVHGDGWIAGGHSSFRQGAGAASPGSPDLETAAAVVQSGYREKTSILGIYSTGAKYRPNEGVRGHQGARRPPGAAPPLAAPPGRARPWWVPSYHILVIPEGSDALIFYQIFQEFLEHF